jgi:hypothetical protein
MNRHEGELRNARGDANCGLVRQTSRSVSPDEPKSSPPTDAIRIAEVAARRALELLRDAGVVAQMMTATQVAYRLNVERAWVYRHAEELGSVRLGDGPNAPLRFPADRIAAFVRPQPSAEPGPNRLQPSGHPRGRRSQLKAQVPLLPYRGDGSLRPAGE